MAKVNTALGAIDATDLGPTLIHEHLVLGYPGYDAD
ncbi:MAG: phosphotriesterase-related protein, partial [Chloroflexi bacterium]|nr:phosphotriesterase-related protein [Chloroflexota bacterium]